jgi:elongation factor 2
MKIKKKDDILATKLRSLGVSNDEIRQYREVYDNCVFLDKTKGEVHIGEVIELVMEAFEQVVDYGVLAREPCVRLKVSLVDTKLHEDAIHRGPAQVLPAVRDAIRLCIMDSKPVLFEPLQQLRVDCPERFINETTRIIQSRRGQLMGVEQEDDRLVVNCTLPVAEMFGLSNDLRSATEGRANFFLVSQSFSKVPSDLQDKIIRQIRQRKGLTENQ